MDGYTCIRCKVQNAAHGFNARLNVTIQDSWVYDQYGFGDSHNEPILSNGGNNINIIHNNLVANFNSASTGGGMSAALALYGDFQQITNVLVENNLFNGGGYCTYAGSAPLKPFPNASNTRFINNHYGRSLNSTCGIYGANIAYSAVNGNQWIGNVWDDTGFPVSAY